jgi:hypothetical protein
LAIDNNSGSFWASQWDMPAWLKIELKQIYTIDHIGIWWGECQHDFILSVSTDNENNLNKFEIVAQEGSVWFDAISCYTDI